MRAFAVTLLALIMGLFAGVVLFASAAGLGWGSIFFAVVCAVAALIVEMRIRRRSR